MRILNQRKEPYIEICESSENNRYNSSAVKLIISETSEKDRKPDKKRL
jgi:hypothetical protein